MQLTAGVTAAPTALGTNLLLLRSIASSCTVSIIRVALVIGWLPFAKPSAAETLPEALASARELNPRVHAARAKSQATDQTIAQARAGFLPHVSANAEANVQTNVHAPSLAPDRSTRTTGYDVTLTQPLFDGWRAASSLDAAKANAMAEQEGVRSAEQQVMIAAVTAYMNVLQDRRLLQLNKENAALLSKTMQATRKRAAVQEATVADLAQAEAALANAQGQVELAGGNLANSEASFEEAVMHVPGQLKSPPAISRLLPANRNEALQMAQDASPGVTAAILREQAAQHAIARARAQLLPTVSLQAGYQRRSDPLSNIGDTDGLVARVVVSIPLYDGGATQAQVYEAQYNRAAAAHQISVIRDQTRTGVAQAWSQLTAARAALESVKLQLAANRKALAGIKEEQRLGQRSVLDLLNAQQAVLVSDTAREQIYRNLVVAAYTMLALVGRLDPMAIEDAAVAAAPQADNKPINIDRH
jgi:outer membrane protein